MTGQARDEEEEVVFDTDILHLETCTNVPTCKLLTYKKNVVRNIHSCIKHFQKIFHNIRK